VAYVSPEGIWLQSFIATWVNSLAPYFERVGLLLHETSIKGGKHDTLIPFKHVKLESLGPEGHTWDRLQRIARIKKKCRSVSHLYEGLLIRGITPRGYTVFKHSSIKSKFFLLVGSLIDSQPRFEFKKIYSYLMYFVRKSELRIIGAQSICLSNSKKVAEEFSNFVEKEVYFTPTSSISESDILPYNENAVDSAEINLLFCGRVTFDKGVFELFKSVKPLRVKLKKKIKLTMIGSVDNETKAMLMDVARKNEFDSEVNWLGFVPYGKMLLNQYCLADFCVLPSYHEGFPHTIWEAGICSVPMVVTSVGGIPGMVSENELSFIKPQSIDSIVETIFQLVSNPIQTKTKTRALYNLAAEYTLEKNAKVLFEILMSKKIKV
jgi:glycosyltransferase involved in cell wall biosynthesis